MCMDKNTEKIINKIISSYKDILGKNLIGIYLHGSIAFGCFNPDKSDIDFIVAVENPLTLTEKIKLIETLLTLDSSAPEKGFEMSIVLEKYCESFIYPTPFELHFSNSHKQKCFDDLQNYFKTLNGVDADLAAHFSVIREVGITVFGKDKKYVFGPVPRDDYLDSIMADIANCAEDIMKNPVYIILNLCRVAAFVSDGIIISKKHGGEWAMGRFSDKYDAIIKTALNSYLGCSEFEYERGELRKFAEYLLDILIRAKELL